MGCKRKYGALLRDQRKEVKELIEQKHIEKDTWIDYLKKLSAEEEQITLEPETPEITTDEDVNILLNNFYGENLEN